MNDRLADATAESIFVDPGDGWRQKAAESSRLEAMARCVEVFSPLHWFKKNTESPVILKLQQPPSYVTVADCGHCFEDAGEPAR